MSTRGLYTFIGETESDTWNVYNHSDNYPTGAAMILKTALDYFCWQLPRYESDAFATGFIAACKCPWLWNGFDTDRFADYGPNGRYRQTTGGGARMMPQGEPVIVAQAHCSDIEYRYEIALGNHGELRVQAYRTNAWEKYSEKLIINCPIQEFPAKARAFQVKELAAYNIKQAKRAKRMERATKFGKVVA